MMKRLFKTLLLAACLAVTAPGNASVTSMQQGTHQWPALNGRLILVNGTYLDITTYKRSLTFYFETKPGADWLHVPVVTSETQQSLTWFSISQGEQTVADAVVVARPGGIELVIAETKPGAPAPVTVRCYRLVEADQEQTYGPAYIFRKISTKSWPAKAGLTVEQVLEKEVAARTKK